MPQDTKSRIDSASSEEPKRIALDECADTIARNKQQEGINYFLIGKVLVVVKAKVPHGKWIEFLNDPRVGFKEDTAQAYMLLGRAPDGAELARLGIAKARLLLTRKPDPQERAAFIAAHRPADLTVAQVEKLLPVERPKKTGRTSKTGQAYEQGRAAGRAEQQATEYQRGFRNGYEEGKAAGRAEQQATEYQRGFRNGYEKGKACAAPAATPAARQEWAAGALYLKPNELTPENVVHAYRELAIVLHPDKALVTNLAFMQRLNEAKDYFLKQHWPKGTTTRPA